MNPRRLYRSRDRQLAGVAGGMAEYLDIDPTITRILWILAAILSFGFVFLAYIVLAIVMPESPYAAAAGAGPAAGATGWAATGPTAGATGWTTPAAGPTGWSAPAPNPASGPAWTATAAADAPVGQRTRGRRFGGAAIVGVVLIVIGGLALADAVLPGWSSAVILGPAVILALGAALLVASIRRNDEPADVSAGPADVSAGPAVPAPAPYEGTDTQPVDPAVPA